MARWSSSSGEGAGGAVTVRVRDRRGAGIDGLGFAALADRGRLGGVCFAPLGLEVPAPPRARRSPGLARPAAARAFHAVLPMASAVCFALRTKKESSSTCTSVQKLAIAGMGGETRWDNVRRSLPGCFRHVASCGGERHRSRRMVRSAWSRRSTRGLAHTLGSGLAPLALLLVVSAGCGHPLNREECDEIFTKTAEIELRAQRVTDPAVIAERTAAARAAEGAAFTNRCVGKRVTTRAQECMRRATTAEQLDRCL
jgi:hypothetical protein